MPEANDNKPLPRYVELIRVSSQKQADRDTPENQRRALDELRARRPGVLVKRIEALAVSGAAPLEERRDLQELADLAKRRAFDELRVYAIDRLTRAIDLRERAAIWGMVADSRAVIIDSTRGNPLDPADESGIGEVDYYLQTFFASRERLRILKRTIDGRRRRANEGRLTAGMPPYGRTFDPDSGVWGIEETEARLYREMFRLCIAGDSVRQIRDRLNERGQRTRLGNVWRASRILDLLRSRSALGEWGAMGVQFTIPAIVDPATFEDAQAVLSKRRTSAKGARGNWPALLRRLLTCAHCGTAVRTEVIRRAGKRRRENEPGTIYYVCGAHEREFPLPCPIPPTFQRAAEIDTAVKAALRELLRSPALMRAAARELAKEAKRSDVARTVEEARAQIARLDSTEQAILRFMRIGKVSPEAAEQQLTELSAQRAALARTLAEHEAANAAAEAARLAQSTLEARLDAIRRRVDKATDVELAQVVRLLFPQGPGTGLKLHLGEVRGIGLLPSVLEPSESGGEQERVLTSPAWKTGQNPLQRGALPFVFAARFGTARLRAPNRVPPAIRRGTRAKPAAASGGKGRKPKR